MTGGIQNVGINALFLNPASSGGPETYLRELVKALAGEFPATRFTVVATPAATAALAEGGWHDIAELRPVGSRQGRANQTVNEQLRLPRLARSEGWDVLHSPATLAPIRAGTASVITFHDVTFFTHKTFNAITTFGMQQITKRSTRRAGALITGSEAARDEICRVLGFSTDQITVVPHGVGRLQSGQAMPEVEVRAKHDLDGRRVVLCVAAKRPHKNQELLLRALAQLPEDVVLVLAGHPEPYDRTLRTLAAELGVASRTRFVDYVPDSELEGLWRVAACAAFPTLQEGFGLPVLEAMQRGVPVACSDIRVFHEVAGDAARYFDPHDPTQAASVIAAAIDDPNLRAAGPRRAARFSWAEAARGTYEAYERAIAAR